MQNTDWDDLRYFLAVAEHGSLSGASSLLGVNHSTVFRRVNRLEEKLSVRLFERLPDGYQLTQPGEEMLYHAARIRDEIDALNLKVSGQDVEPAGTVRVSAPDSLAYNFINRYVVDFLEKYPLINVELDVNNSSLDLSRRETDIAVRATRSPPGHLVGRKVCSVDWVFFASQDYLRVSRKVAGTPTSMSDLKRHKLIGPDGPVRQLKAYRILDKLMLGAYRVRANSLTAIASLAMAGNGVALLPDDQIGTGMKRLFPVHPGIQSDIWILLHPELRATTRIKLLSSFLAECFRNDPFLGGQTGANRVLSS